MKVKKIAFKLWLGMMTLVVIMLAVMWIFQVVFLQNNYLEGKAHQLNAYAYALANLVATGDLTTMDYINELDESLNISTLIVAPSGNLQFIASEYAGNVLGSCLKRLPEVINGQSFTDYVVRGRFELRYVRIGMPVGDGGALFLIMPVSDVSGTIAILKDQFFYLSIIMSSAAVIVATVLASFITKPISALTHQATKMAKGDLETSFSSNAHDEIGELAHTLEHLRTSLLQLDKLRRELIANISHELRTPLAIIRGFAETVRDVSYKDEAKREKHLGAIIDESVRLEKIVNEILDYSQLQSGDANYKKDKVNLSLLCNVVAERMQQYYEKGEIQLVSSIESDLFVTGDEVKIGQVLFNLLANAFNHSPAGSAVNLTLKKHGNMARIEVEDKGEGIAAQDLSHIWDRYYRATLKDRSQRIGSGLGLAVCKNILEAHDARYGVESELGKGSLFAFELSTT